VDKPKGHNETPANRTTGHSRRDFLKQTGAVSAGLLLNAMTRQGFGVGNTAAGRMNLVIITTDDNDADSLGCFGCPLPDVTPYMDRLAREGVRFEHAHTASPTCQPSRLCLMTGRHPQTNGNTGHVDPLKKGVPTLALELKKAGYFTVLVGKEPNYAPYDAFKWDKHQMTADTWDDASDGYWSMWRSPEGFYKGTKELIGEAKQHGGPFFLHLNTSDPHRPWPGSIDEVESLQRFSKQWGKKATPLRPYPRNYSPFEVPVPGYLPDLPGVRVDVAEYFSAMHNADLAVGRILDALEEEGLKESTIVICFGDQGAPFPMSKQNLYRTSTRIPLIIRWPGVTGPGSVIDHTMVSIIDLMPTLLEGLGLTLPADMDGRSIFPLLGGGTEENRDYVFTSYNYALPSVQTFPMRAVQSKEFLYIYNSWPGEYNIEPKYPLRYDGVIDPLTGLCWKSMKEAAARNPALAERVNFIINRAPEEFYDLRKDPYCLDNLVDDPAHRRKAAEMRKMVEGQMERTKDPLLAKFHGTGPIPPEWLKRKPR